MKPNVFRDALAVKEVTVPVLGLGTGLDGLRIAHVSDFHFRKWSDVFEQARRKLATLDYDLLAATGDFCSRRGAWKSAAAMCRRFFDGLQPSLGAYAVLGNHDHPRFGDAPDLPFRVLRNENVRLDIGGSCLVVAGVDRHPGGGDEIAAALSPVGCVPDAPNVVLLAHYPSTIFKLPPGRVGLQLSGHTHGGQIRLPLVGCVWANDRLPRRMVRGLHKVADTLLHVSAGVGVSAPIRIRYRCPPEISLVTLRSAEQIGAQGRGCGLDQRNHSPIRELAANV